MRRVIGATTNTVGKATIQLNTHDVIHGAINGLPASSTRTVAINETIQDIRPDRIKPNRTGANRAGIIAKTSISKLIASGPLGRTRR